MNELTSMLTTTGLIATLISLLFAVASLVIATRRKKHHLAMQQQHGAHVPTAPVAPVKVEAPMTFKAVAPGAPPPAPVSKPENLVYDTRPTSSPLFKRLGRVGVEQVLPVTSPEATTPQEQKSAWE